MITESQTLTIHIKPEKLDAFKEKVLTCYHNDFIKTNEPILNNIRIMKDICKEDTDFLLHCLKEKYQPIQFSESMEVQYDILSQRYEHDYSSLSIVLSMYLNGVKISSFILNGKDRDRHIEMPYFTVETINQIRTILFNAIEQVEAECKRMELQDHLEESINEVKPPELRSKIRSLVEKLK